MKLFSFDYGFIRLDQHPVVGGYELTIGNKLLGLVWTHSTNGGVGKRLVLRLLGLWVVFGWIGNCIQPVLQFRFSRKKEDWLGLLHITIRFYRYNETELYIRLGQFIYERLGSVGSVDGKRVLEINVYSQHFIRFARWLKCNVPLIGSLLASYKVTGEWPDQSYTAKGRILFLTHEVWM